ncbi:Splicing factor, arginine/serine-rich 1 [Intoshia linei]|uniref:Splicing factor, arginine/serine-rich 1 n=1 Tax=Intoshia linei TaxID=1819745 RepID=A0A177AXI7_9BILA|nr:Splicing factor, arginine/serine-rich 1 [Intoshia linei]
MKTKLFIGNLPPDTNKRDIDDIFSKFGKIEYTEVKVKDGQCFGFVEFRDEKDTSEALNQRDGYRFDGFKIRVEYSHDSKGRSRDDRYNDRSYNHSHSNNYHNNYNNNNRNAAPSRFRYQKPERSPYRIYIEGLPESGSWQDIKDHMREAGHVCFTESYKNGEGIVEFAYKSDMSYALRKLDNSKFRSHLGESARVRLYSRDKNSRRNARYSNSRSDSRSRSRSRSVRKRRKFRSRSVSSKSARRNRSYSDKSSRSNSRSRSNSSRTSY